MDPALREAWTRIVTIEDYERHMAAVGQAQAGAALARHILLTVAPAPGARSAIAGAGAGQMFDYLDPALFRPYRLCCTDLNPAYLARLGERLRALGIAATLLEDDLERTTLAPAPDLLLATLLFEHIDWRRGVEAFAGLAPAAIGLVIQENPPGMASAVTPGRQLPPSLARAMETAHAQLVPRGELVDAFAARGYRCAGAREEHVADGKHLTALVFAPREGSPAAATVPA